jgi:hypothetical protein
MKVAFLYVDPRSSFWPGPVGHTIETERFLAMQRFAPEIVSWRGRFYGLESVLLDARFDTVEVRYARTLAETEDPS